MTTKLIGTSLLLLSILAASCGGQAGEKLRPKDYTAANALGAPLPVCTGEPKVAMPLVLDLDTDARIDLEAAMKKSVVVVAYDCNTLRVLSNCKVNDDNYEYAAIDRRERVYRLKGEDELKVNLPTSAGKFGAEVKAGRTIDLGIVMIGRRTSHTGSVDRDQLVGTCEGATHFLQKATIGAFSIVTGSVGKAAAVADVFSVGARGSSESTRDSTTQDGSLEACRSAAADADSPPPQCRSPISVELTPIRGKSSASASVAAVASKEEPKAKPSEEAPPPPAAGQSAGPAGEENPCREGYLYSGGICTKEPSDTGYLCELTNFKECKEQCEKGNVGSCYNGGKWASEEEAPPLFKKACDGQHGDACYELGRFVRPKYSEKGTEADFKKAYELFKHACDLGSGYGCTEVAITLSEERTSFMRDLPASFRAWRRACALGNSTGCFWAATGYADGIGTAKDPQKGIDLFAKACAGGNDKVCVDFVNALSWGQKYPKDLARAAPIAKKLCETAEAHNPYPGIKSDEASKCERAAEVLGELGKDDEAFKYAKRACESDSEAHCLVMGRMIAAGRGTKKDPGAANAIFKKYCASEMNRIADGIDANTSVCKKFGGAVPAKPKPGKPKPKK